MGQVVIRDVPDDVIEAHRQRARARGLSLEQELRAVIEAAAAYSAVQKLAIAECSQSLTPPGARGPADSRRSRSVDTAVVAGAPEGDGEK
jgi:plasmid stability protein